MHAEKSYHTVSRMARLLEVSRSGFYAWSTRGASKRAVRAERFEAKIAWFHGVFATLRTEFYYRRIWPTKAGAKQAVGAWIEDRYNRRRRHSSIGQTSPVTFERQHCNQTAADQEAA